MNPVHVLANDFFKICFKTIPVSKSRFSKLHLFLRGSPQKPVLMCVICPTQLILLDWWPELYLKKSMRPTLLIVLFLRSPVTFCYLCPNNFPDTHFSGTLSLCSFLIIRYRVSRLYKTSVKTTLLFLINIMFLVGKQEDKRFWTER